MTMTAEGSGPENRRFIGIPEASETPAAVQMLRLAQVCKITGLGRSMIYQLEAEHRFPSRIKLATRAVGWIEGEVQAWLARRIESSRGGPREGSGTSSAR